MRQSPNILTLTPAAAPNPWQGSTLQHVQYHYGSDKAKDEGEDGVRNESKIPSGIKVRTRLISKQNRFNPTITVQRRTDVIVITVTHFKSQVIELGIHLGYFDQGSWVCEVKITLWGGWLPNWKLIEKDDLIINYRPDEVGFVKCVFLKLGLRHCADGYLGESQTNKLPNFYSPDKFLLYFYFSKISRAYC
jgi:hypothetical protein